MQTLITRSISGIIYVSLFLFAILFSENTYIGLISVFAFVSLWEFKKLINLKNIFPYILLPIIIYLCKEFASEKLRFILIIITLLCSIRLLFHLYSKNSNYPITLIGKLDVSIRYIILPFTFLILLPFMKDGYNHNIIIYIIILIWINDSFAFFVGKNFGKRKLFERISPKKTIEGFVGGLIFSVIAGVFIGNYNSDFSVLNGVIIAIIVSVFGTFGDLVESKFKRQANVKDSGKIMPGHGGILDRLDSLLFIAPFVYLYTHYCI